MYHHQRSIIWSICVLYAESVNDSRPLTSISASNGDNEGGWLGKSGRMGNKGGHSGRLQQDLRHLTRHTSLDGRQERKELWALNGSMLFVPREKVEAAKTHLRVDISPFKVAAYFSAVEEM